LFQMHGTVYYWSMACCRQSMCGWMVKIRINLNRTWLGNKLVHFGEQLTLMVLGLLSSFHRDVNIP
jgi:hypothetical protein